MAVWAVLESVGNFLMVTRFGSSVIAIKGASSEGVVNFLLETDVVISEFAHLGVVNTKDFGLFGGTKTKTGNEMHDPEDGGLMRECSDQTAWNIFSLKLDTYSHHEGISETSSRVCNLVTKLDPVVVEPTSRNISKAIEPSDTGLCEESGEDVADHATDSMRSEDL